MQYGLLVWGVFASASQPDQLVSVDYGTAAVADQAERLILLLLMTLLTATIVYRMQRLVELSGRDGLTGLPNRTVAAAADAADLRCACARSGGSLTLALLDLDRFRRINDEIGHLDGDRAIRQIAAVLARSAGRPRAPGPRWAARNSCCCCTARSAAPGNASTALRRDARRTPVPARARRRTAAHHLQRRPGRLAAGRRRPVSALLGSADRRLQLAKRDGCNRVMARDV